MFWKVLATTFAAVFIAEIGDKTQLATMLFSSKPGASRWAVFAGASLALVVAAAIAVIVGAQLERFVKPSTLKLVAGIGFIVIGVWTLITRSS